MSKICLALVLLFTAIDSIAQNEDSIMIRRIADDVFVNGRAYENLRTLTKQVGARLAGSPGMYKAEAWGQQA
ncbi:MAG TPA: peptidase M28 family protein, partial [Chitinophagaceae bacterium]